MGVDPHGSVPIDLAYDAISRMDADSLVALCDPGVRFESRITAIEHETYEGHDGVRSYIANLADAFEHVDVRQSDLVEHGDRAVATNRFRARGRGSGLEVEQQFFVAARARGGKLLWWGFFDSRADALRAAGLEHTARPSANLQLVRSIFADWLCGDWRSAEWAAPDIEFERKGSTGGRWRGLRGMAEGWHDWLSAWEDFRVATVEEYRELDDERILVLHRFTARGKSSGLAVEDTQPKGATLFHIRDGKVTRLVAYAPREEAFADLGLDG